MKWLQRNGQQLFTVIAATLMLIMLAAITTAVVVMAIRAVQLIDVT